MKIKVFDSKTLRNIIEINLALVTKIQNECIIGRSPESGIVLDSADVSRMHGKLVLENENYYFCDLGSRNGSLINGKIAETSRKYLLNPGDTIRLGEFVLILEDINSQPDNSAETVYRGLDATVVASLRDGANVNQGYYNYQAPVVNQVPEVVQNEEPVTVPEEVTTYQERTQVQQSEISVPENVIETPQDESQIAEAINQPVELTGTDNPSENTDHNQPEEITLTPEAPLELILSEESNDIANAITVIPTSETLDLPSTYENIESIEDRAITTEEALDYNNTPELDVEEVIAREIPVVQANEVSEEAIIQPVEQIKIFETSETNNLLSSEEVSDVTEQETSELDIPEQEILEQNTYQQEIPEPEELNEPLVSNYQALETTNDVFIQLEEAEPVIQVSEATCCLQEETTEEIAKEKIPEKSKIISTKYIALLAHDSKRFEIAQFAAKHQEFFSNCLTIAPPSISEILSSQAGITTTEQTSAATSGGYQAIAAKVASGDILAVIFLRDFLQVQSNVANEEAMLRVCNINEVMIATNLPTAEAIVDYIRFSENIP
ncbi:hypothetical protein NIES2101_19145 [Calothrix sp. HK-06]|nr:hypothetical protein NIES2101_19145 [Calothrix sp. HK-06]